MLSLGCVNGPRSISVRRKPVGKSAGRPGPRVQVARGAHRSSAIPAGRRHPRPSDPAGAHQETGKRRRRFAVVARLEPADGGPERDQRIAGRHRRADRGTDAAARCAAEKTRSVSRDGFDRRRRRRRSASPEPSAGRGAGMRRRTPNGSPRRSRRRRAANRRTTFPSSHRDARRLPFRHAHRERGAHVLQLAVRKRDDQRPGCAHGRRGSAAPPARELTLSRPFAARNASTRRPRRRPRMPARGPDARRHAGRARAKSEGAATSAAAAAGQSARRQPRVAELRALGLVSVASKAASSRVRSRSDASSSTARRRPRGPAPQQPLPARRATAASRRRRAHTAGAVRSPPLGAGEPAVAQAPTSKSLGHGAGFMLAHPSARRSSRRAACRRVQTVPIGISAPPRSPGRSALRPRPSGSVTRFGSLMRGARARRPCAACSAGRGSTLPAADRQRRQERREAAERSAAGGGEAAQRCRSARGGRRGARRSGAAI